MKKMFLAAAIICTAVISQAASVSWKTVTMYNDNEGKVGNSANVYVYMLANQAAYDGLTDIWGTYGDDIKAGGTTASASKNTSLSKVTLYSPNGTSEPDTTYYAAIIATIGTGDDMKYFAEKAAVTTGEDGGGAYIFGEGKLDTAAVAKSAWQSVSVPEPTSGLLLLVGGALLALRRKQK